MRAIASSAGPGPEHVDFALPIPAPGGTFAGYLDEAL
jgi:hypothetical protein